MLNVIDLNRGDAHASKINRSPGDGPGASPIAKSSSSNDIGGACLEMVVEVQRARVALVDLVRLEESVEAEDRRPEVLQRRAEQAPEGCVALADRDAEVDVVRVGLVGVRPVARRDRVVRPDAAVERLRPDDVDVRVDAAVLDHDLAAEDVADEVHAAGALAVRVRRDDAPDERDAIVDRQLRPVVARGRHVAVDIQPVDVDDVQQREAAEVEEEVDRPAVQPHDVGDVRNEVVGVGRRGGYLLAAVHQQADGGAVPVRSLPEVLRVDLPRFVHARRVGRQRGRTRPRRHAHGRRSAEVDGGVVGLRRGVAFARRPQVVDVVAVQLGEFAQEDRAATDVDAAVASDGRAHEAGP